MELALKTNFIICIITILLLHSCCSLLTNTIKIMYYNEIIYLIVYYNIILLLELYVMNQSDLWVVFFVTFLLFMEK